MTEVNNRDRARECCELLKMAVNELGWDGELWHDNHILLWGNSRTEYEDEREDGSLDLCVFVDSEKCLLRIFGDILMVHERALEKCMTALPMVNAHTPAGSYTYSPGYVSHFGYLRYTMEQSCWEAPMDLAYFMTLLKNIDDHTKTTRKRLWALFHNKMTPEDFLRTEQEEN